MLNKIQSNNKHGNFTVGRVFNLTSHKPLGLDVFLLTVNIIVARRFQLTITSVRLQRIVNCRTGKFYICGFIILIHCLARTV